MKKSIIFPGQGSQFVGMGFDFFKEFQVARDVYEEVDDILKINLSKIIFEDRDGSLNLTKNTQPAIMTTGVAIFRVLKKEKGIQITDFDFCAGHSLGEYTALVCAESISLKNAAILLKSRGEAMQDAVKVGDGAMAAILGAETEEVENIINQLHPSSVEISNDNCPGQVVISGKSKEVEKCCLEIKNTIFKKSIMLPVSAPFHCKLMIPASIKMRDLINNASMSDPIIPLVSNVQAAEVKKTPLIKSLLVDQIHKRVRWREIIEYMLKNNVTNFMEIGPGKTLAGMLKRFKKNIEIQNFNMISDLD